MCVWERESKEKQERLFISRETNIKIIVINLTIVKLFGVYPVVFPFKLRVFHVNLYSCVWLLFWIANICDNIIWDPTLSWCVNHPWKIIIINRAFAFHGHYPFLGGFILNQKYLAWYYEAICVWISGSMSSVMDK